jgi:hypothetical protein
MSPDRKTDAVRSPTFAEGMSNGQIITSGTMHQPANAPLRPRSRYRRSGATAAQPYALNIARKSQPTLFTGGCARKAQCDLAPSTIVSGAFIVADLGPGRNRSPQI